MDNSKRKGPHWICGYAIAVALLAVVVNFFMYLPIPTLKTLDSGDWLSFWGGYLGGVIGCIPAFAALHESRRQSKQQHEEVQEQLKESRKQAAQAQFESLETRRCSILPVADVTLMSIFKYPEKDELNDIFGLIDDQSGIDFTQSISSFTHEEYNKNPHLYYILDLTNIGLGPALSIKVTAKIHHEFDTRFLDSDLPPGRHLKMILKITPLKENENSRTVVFKTSYQDVFSNIYERDYSVKWTKNSFASIESPIPRLVQRGSFYNN